MNLRDHQASVPRGNGKGAVLLGLGLALLLAVPLAWPAPAVVFRILDQPSRQVRELAVHQEPGADCLELGELARALGGSLAWERPGERLTWTLDGRTLAFEDRMAFITAGEQSWQLVAPCRLEGGRFLVPLQLAVECLPRLWPERFSFSKTEDRLVDRGGQPEAAAQARKPAAPTAPPAAVPVRGDGGSYRITTVVIDPGHGGRDPGALGRHFRLREKDLVLEIALEVARRVREAGQLKVLLTRDGDRLIPLKERGQLANERGAGLFVSIHCNAHRQTGVRGASTYFLDAAKTDEERATAMLENSSLEFEGQEGTQAPRGDAVALILQDMAQNEYLRESKDLCAFIQQELVGLGRLPDKGIRQANFAVLRGAYMPAALIETAYMSNAEDEKMLRDQGFRGRLAGAIAGGILKYIETYHRKLATGS